MKNPVLRNSEGENKNPLSNERGVILLVALVVVTLLVVLVVEFDYGTRVSLTTAGSFRDGVQATYLARSGVRAAQAVLIEDAKTSGTYDATTEFWATPVPPYPIGDGFVSIQITDELSKLNINLLNKKTDYEKWREVWERLFVVLEIEPVVLYAIKDWIDEDSDVTGFDGAEASYYESLEPPYTAKNGPIDSLGELLLVKGVSGEVYQKLLTGCEGLPCITLAATKAVNVNTVSLELCQALHAALNEEDCQNLAGVRPIESTANDNEFPEGWTGLSGGTGSTAGIRFDIKALITTKSDFFSILSTGEVQGTQRVVEALVKRNGKKVKLLRWRLI